VNHQNEENWTDQALVEKVLRGDSHAFKSLINHTEFLVAHIIFKMVTNETDRRDIAQDVYLKVYQNLTGFRFKSKLSTWVAQITYNTCINYLRKKKIVFDHYDLGEEERFHITRHNAEFVIYETEQFLFNKELSRILKTEIDNLSPIFRTLITLYHQDELSYAEIAEITALPEGTVKSYLFRARKALKDKLACMYNKEAL
jgi:RNA polymerase sigma-70 factor (ECF subfamily)